MASVVIPGLEIPSGTPLVYEVEVDLKPFQMIFVAAHGKSILPSGVLGKYGRKVIPGLEIPNGTRLVYEVDADLRPIPKESSSRLMATPCVCHVKYLEGMADDVIPGLEMPSGTPLMYEVDADLKANPNEFSSRLMAIPSAPS